MICGRAADIHDLIHPEKKTDRGWPRDISNTSDTSLGPLVAVGREAYTCPTAPNLGSLLHANEPLTHLGDNRL